MQELVVVDEPRQLHASLCSLPHDSWSFAPEITNCNKLFSDYQKTEMMRHLLSGTTKKDVMGFLSCPNRQLRFSLSINGSSSSGKSGDDSENMGENGNGDSSFRSFFCGWRR